MAETAGVELVEMMALEPHGPDTFVGIGPEYPWGGLYGGQIVAQSLRAAGLTVDAGFHPHSLHAYFVRRGDAKEPIRFEVERVRNGRSFVTRSVEARQSTGAILTMTASFHVDEHEAATIQVATMPDLPAPEGLPTGGYGLFDRRSVASEEAGRAAAWIRVRGDFVDDRLMQACALAYASDDLPTEAVVASHPGRRPWEGGDGGFMSASLDHAIWFHRPGRADDWQLHDFRAGGYSGARGMCTGHLFSPDGTHVATVAQEVLLRTGR